MIIIAKNMYVSDVSVHFIPWPKFAIKWRPSASLTTQLTLRLLRSSRKVMHSDVIGLCWASPAYLQRCCLLLGQQGNPLGGYKGQVQRICVNCIIIIFLFRLACGLKANFREGISESLLLFHPSHLNNDSPGQGLAITLCVFYHKIGSWCQFRLRK